MVVPYVGTLRCDVGIRAGRIAALVDSIAPADADVVVDARGRLVLPGGVDSHFHIGIYRDLAIDARSETASALAGGVTTVISYFRTGLNYLNKSGLNEKWLLDRNQNWFIHEWLLDHTAAREWTVLHAKLRDDPKATVRLVKPAATAA